jgi:hypothetical protein
MLNDGANESIGSRSVSDNRRPAVARVDFARYSMQVQREYHLPRAILTLIEYSCERKLAYIINIIKLLTWD